MAEREARSFLGLVGGGWSLVAVPELEIGISGSYRIHIYARPLGEVAPASDSTEAQRSSSMPREIQNQKAPEAFLQKLHSRESSLE